MADDHAGHWLWRRGRGTNGEPAHAYGGAPSCHTSAAHRFRQHERQRIRGAGEGGMKRGYQLGRPGLAEIKLRLYPAQSFADVGLSRTARYEIYVCPRR